MKLSIFSRLSRGGKYSKLITMLLSWLVLFAAFPAVLSTQQHPQAVLIYFENNSGNFDIVTPKETISAEAIGIGNQIPVGSTLVTGEDDFAEVELLPSGSVIKVSENTNFEISQIQGVSGATSSEFKSPVGKFLAVIEKVTGSNTYNFSGKTAVMGVRGTRILVSNKAGNDEVYAVLDGEAELTRGENKVVISAGYSVSLSTNMLNAVENKLNPVKISESLRDELLTGMEFEKLDPANVRGGLDTPTSNDSEQAENATEADSTLDDETLAEELQTEEQEEPEESEEQEEPEESEEPEEQEEDSSDTKATPDSPETTEQPLVQPPETPEISTDAYSYDENDPLTLWLRDMLGMEIGSVTIDNITYSKAVLQPVFDFGGLRLGLYLPIVYQNDLFNPSNWHKPKGNNEWSFGSDKSGFEDAALDFITDLSLKIRSVSLGNNRDAFFFKFFNVNDITVGHGSIMRDYANDAEFPAVRRVGVNLGVNTENFTIEGVLNDISSPEIFGGRLALRVLGPIGIGVTGIADISPFTDAESGSLAAEAKPWFLNLGADLDLPLIESDTLSAIIFADIAGLIPGTQKAVTVDSNNVSAGFHTDAIFTGNSFRNWGLSTGIFGNIFLFDYRAEFRMYNGSFISAFYNKNYERSRAAYAEEVMTYLGQTKGGSSTAGSNVLGVYAEGGFEIKKHLAMDLGYMWPLEIKSDGSLGSSDDDIFHLEIVVKPGIVPNFPVHGKVAYDRVKFASTFDVSKSLNFFDVNTVVSAEIAYELEKNVDVTMLYTTAVARDSSGKVTYTGGVADINSSVAVNVKVKPL